MTERDKEDKEDKEEYNVTETDAPSGFDLAKIVSDMLADPSTFESCRKLGEAVLAKSEKLDRSGDSELHRLIYNYGCLKCSGISFGDPLDYCSLMLFDAGLFDEIRDTIGGIESEVAEELKRLMTMPTIAGVKILTSDRFDEICDSLRQLIEDLGGRITL